MGGCSCRKTILLPDTLLEHISVCIEEGLYSQGFSLLTSTLIAGGGTPRPAYVPPAHIFALAATLAVHPSMTTRTNTQDKRSAADDALRYLRLAQKTVGVDGASMREAFRFNKSQDSRAQRARFRKSSDLDEKPFEKLKCPFTTEKQSLWDRSEDFWHLLGWALNCSVVEPRRWARWHLLLSILLDALEDDLQQVILENTTDAPESSQLATAALNDSLIVQFLRHGNNGKQNKRRIMRAILADGTTKSLAEFGQVWDNETAEPSEATRTKKRQKLDIEKGQYGDYDDDSDEELTRSILSVAPVEQVKASEMAHDYSNYDATVFRQRVLAILVKVCSAEPGAYITLEDLFDIYVEFLKPLPLAQFEDIAIGTAARLDANSQSTFYQRLLRTSIDSTAPLYNRNELTQEDFVKHFAGFAANSASITENAKVSLLVERMLRLLRKHELLAYDDDLRQAVSHGIAARAARATGVANHFGSQCLQSSGERMLAVLKLMQENV